MKENKEITNRGINAVELLQVIFIVLKILNKIQWSWLWVLAPIWISIIIFIIGFLSFMLIAKMNSKRW